MSEEEEKGAVKAAREMGKSGAAERERAEAQAVWEGVVAERAEATDSGWAAAGLGWVEAADWEVKEAGEKATEVLAVEATEKEGPGEEE